METNKILMTLGAIAVTFLLLFGVYKLTNPPVQTNFPEVNKINANDHIFWSQEKKNILVEYSDFECPACQNFHNFLKQLEATDGADITKKTTYVYRHYPLTQIHPNALFAAYAAEAAGRQGKFNGMSDLLFNKQNEWGTLTDAKNYFINLANDLKLNVEQFKKDLDSQAVKDKVAADIASGDKAGLNSTPTFFYNGKRLEGIESFDQFRQALRNP